MGRQSIRTYICMDCLVVFRIASNVGNKSRFFCPVCGDNVSTQPYKRISDRIYRPWTTGELQWLDRIIQGELYHYQVAAKLNRSIKSIRQRTYKRIEELKESASIESSN